MKKRGLALLIVLIAVVCSLTGCNKEIVRNYNNGDANFKNSAQSSSFYGLSATAGEIYSYSCSLTLVAKNKEEAVESVDSLITAVGGKIDYTSNRDYERYYKISVPTDKFESFISDVKELGKTYDESVDAENVTDKYVTALAKKEALEDKKTALEALLAEATETADKLLITNEIYEVNEQIKTYEEKALTYQGAEIYSTVYLSVYEESTYVEPSFWEEIADVFLSSTSSIGFVFRGLIFMLTGILPYALLVCAVFGIYVLIKLIVCKAMKKKFTLFAKARERRAISKKQTEEYLARQRARYNVNNDGEKQ